MRILLLADPHGPGDEGARNVSKQIYKLLSVNHEVLCIPAPKVIKKLRQIKLFNPCIIHAIHGPSIRTFYLLALLHTISPESTLFISLIQPEEELLNSKWPFWRKFHFINILSQEINSENVFTQAGFNTFPIPNGVDLDKFKPVKPNLPMELSNIIPSNKRLLLHVGHIKTSRGLDLLASLSNMQNWHIIIVGSSRYPAEQKMLDILNKAGCTVYQAFIEDLPGLYCYADAYIFPVSDPGGCIDIPLTVLEALACNRPVISTQFEALPRFISEGNGMFYINSKEDIINCLDQISNNGEAMTRQKVLDLSWNKIIDSIIKQYTKYKKY